MGIGLFVGVRGAAGAVVVAMCERWLSHRGVDGCVVDIGFVEVAVFRGCCPLGVSVVRLCVSAGLHIVAWMGCGWCWVCGSGCFPRLLSLGSVRCSAMCECRLAHWMCLWCGLMWEWPFSGFSCVAGAVAAAMCERWLAHSRCLWCGWIRGWAVFGVSLCVGCCFGGYV